jgi:hypothetical protein
VLRQIFEGATFQHSGSSRIGRHTLPEVWFAQPCFDLRLRYDKSSKARPQHAGSSRMGRHFSASGDPAVPRRGPQRRGAFPAPPLHLKTSPRTARRSLRPSAPGDCLPVNLTRWPVQPSPVCCPSKPDDQSHILSVSALGASDSEPASR